MLVEREWLFLENRRVSTRLKAVKLKHQATIEDIDFHTPRGLEKSVFFSSQTASGSKAITTSSSPVPPASENPIWQRLSLTRPAAKAVRPGSIARRGCPRTPQAKGGGSYAVLLLKIAKTDLVVIDDWGLAPLTDLERRDLLEIMEDRHGIRSTLITSQYLVTTWHELIGEPTRPTLSSTGSFTTPS